jgi:hypothetical protein
MSLVFRNNDYNRLLQEMHNTDKGSHMMLIYPDKNTLNKIYTNYIAEVLESNHNDMLVVYISFYEPVNMVRNNFVRTGILSKDSLEKYEMNGSLLIVDNVKTHFGSDFELHLERKMLARRAENQEKRGGAVIMADMGWYHLEDNVDALIDSEMQTPKKIDDINCKTFCLYHRDDFGRLSKDQQEMLRDQHLKSLEMSM